MIHHNQHHMDELASRNQRSPAPQHASPKYTRLKTAALAFIAAQTHTPSLAHGMDTAALRNCVTPAYAHAFGPDYAVSQAPKLQGAFKIDGFIAHTQKMIPALETWEVRIEGVVVDEVGESVAVRVKYEMRVKGVGEGIRNDVVWWLEMEEGTGRGEGWRVRRSVEMVDGVAAGRIGELVLGVGGDGEVAGGE